MEGRVWTSVVHKGTFFLNREALNSFICTLELLLTLSLLLNNWVVQFGNGACLSLEWCLISFLWGVFSVLFMEKHKEIFLKLFFIFHNGHSSWANDKIDHTLRSGVILMNNNLIGKHKAGQGAGEFKSLVFLKCSDSVSLSAKSHQNYMHVKNRENHVFRPITVKVCFWASCTLHWTLWLLLLQKGIAFIGEWWFLSDCFNYFNLSSVLVTQCSFIPFIWMFATSNLPL